MALQKQVEFKGLVVPAAYFEIVGVAADKTADRTQVLFKVHTDALKEHQLDLRVVDCPYNPDATVAWAYNQLKTLPEFAGAVDV